jgi:hypothetical protein
MMIEVIRPAISARPGSGGRSVPADTVGHCGVTVLSVDETGFHTDRCSLVQHLGRAWSSMV